MMKEGFFAFMQRLSRALILPVVVLPIAGLLLRLGQPDVFNIQSISKSGQILFDNLPLLFAIGISGGFAKDNHCSSSVAGAMGYLVLTTVMRAINPNLNMGALAGVIVGIIAGVIYNRYHNIQLPDFLAFFEGRRFVPIATGLLSLLLGLLIALVWVPVQSGITHLGNWLIAFGPIGPFLYGTLNAILRVVGLHHILNSLVWFMCGSFTTSNGAVVTGDIYRFFAGDPAAGEFMTGYFPVFMFALPAGCLAMYHAAPKDKRSAVGGVFLSLVLTTILTGITEPLEYTFLFLSPSLYCIHALLTGLSMAICQMLGIHVGFTFSAGLIDYLLSFGISTRALLIIPVGLVYAVIYYSLFRFFINRFNLSTLGKGSDHKTASTLMVDNRKSDLMATYLVALGGKENIILVDTCITSLHLKVVESDMISEAELKKWGAMEVIKHDKNNIQVVVGTKAEMMARQIRAHMLQ